jgi:hypothetical protein
MARSRIALIAALLALPALTLTACQSSQQGHLSATTSARAVTGELAKNLPQKLPETCTAEMQAAHPRADEPWVVTLDRWRVLRTSRNDQAAACGAWWTDYRRRLSAKDFDNFGSKGSVRRVTAATATVATVED